LATSSEPSDDPLEEVCRQENITCYRGDLDDVLNRFYQAAIPYNPEYIVRLTGDCPLTDPVLIDSLITFFLEGGYDYCSNCLEPTFPDGLDAEIFRLSCLESAWKEAKLPSQREHVTPYINQQPDKFKLGCMKNDQNLSDLRWTVDEPADFEFVACVYEALYSNNPIFTTNDILKLLEERPDLQRINSAIKRNEGFVKSQRKDDLYKKKMEL
jgi:spore coat polysaccharide biosynthesis protein SpsF